ncbi:MAG: glycine zipper 2TM domain-containing protein [PS1 clade bacterium]|uniref:17 kDa surface antigen n=1 Tax=PS1 clade bacterium TaxID=2175152 RepID=A0A368E363_9PROT|nr:MAG: glycine zipper 2TM domain-containing protein [PS1 clade bacterium]
MFSIKTPVIWSTVIAFSLIQAGCAENPNRQQEIGAVTGLLLGGLVGSQIGDGKGRNAAIVAGALLGTLAGSEIGRRLDEADRMKMGMATSDALNNNKIGTSSRWQSDRSDIAGAVTPTRDYTDENGNYCREIKQTVVIGGETQQETGQACREKDGSWSLS